MPDYDEYLREPSERRRKYKVYCGNGWNNDWCKHWTVLLSVAPFESEGCCSIPEESENSVPSPLAGSGPGGHKPSFKSTKLARRARSFKDDFLGKISQMRSPINPALRANSPKGRTTTTTATKTDAEAICPTKGPVQELDVLGKQIQIALKHFRDVVSKNTLEMLPGNGTIILDTVWTINLVVTSSVQTESSSIMSATNHMYQSVAKLIKLCDDVLIYGDKSVALSVDNVKEVVQMVEEAVQNLIKLAQEKLVGQQTPYKATTLRSSYANLVEKPVQRNSLPDIPLTPREREILEQTSHVPGVVRNSHSTESILRDSSPPPKPPLPDGISHSEPASCITPPPLPPKRRYNNRIHQLTDEYFSSDNSLLTSSLERMSLRSRSPEDSSSLLSASAGSLDSMLNQSREEEEIKAIMDHTGDSDIGVDNDFSEVIGASGICTCAWEDNSTNPHDSTNHLCDPQHNNNLMHRFSNTDSGFMSSHSHRCSSYSKRSSQQSSISSHMNMSTTKQQSSSMVSSEMFKSESVTQNLSQHAESASSVKSFTQKVSSNSSISSSVTVTGGGSNGRLLGVDEVDFRNKNELMPPAIPQKTRRKQDRQSSPYDNVSDVGEVLVTCQMHQSQQITPDGTTQDNKPPPLPPKKRHIMAYMEMFGNCSHSNDQEFLRHSVHMVQSQWGTQHNLATMQSRSFSHSSYSSSLSSHSRQQTLSLPPHSINDQIRETSPLPSPNSSVTTPITTTPPALPPKQRPKASPALPSPPRIESPIEPVIAPSPPPPLPLLPPPTTTITQTTKALPDLLEHAAAVETKNAEIVEADQEMNPCAIDLMEELDVDKYLVWKPAEDEGPEIRGGTIDALIIQATKATKNGVFTYQEAFLTTYRTFISPYDLIFKLIRRYNYFYYQPDRRPRSREAFALIVRVVSDITASDLNNQLQQMIMSFVYQLICCRELTLAKALRIKHLERHETFKKNEQMNLKYADVIFTVTLSPRNSTLLDFKSEQIAEQMTLLDAELFMRIEIPEVLIWAQEQNEERSPNLTMFTEHFNKMSYWARTRILNAETKDIREKYFMKFIKIMKHLRKINNFNSYLALLSALDSAPVRRLEWQKHVQEGLKEYCALIDSSSSFRAYRQALAETQPPCIPYIGLVLQDLTFVHIGNSDYLPDGKINFAKRWQQFNILENMKRFKKSTYQFKRNERIINFFQNFNDHINEDAMWQLSESIKPRGGKKTT